MSILQFTVDSANSLPASGRGFSVVADEIRKLAEQSKVSSESISKLINEISKDTD